ncbi:AraC family transcriptional regulator N-terminal domain-containing protein [Cryptosporangium sp. NPDC048952]|uniref:AraC family transcriptional regulator n=1 Tax=Cryptosporangium sp. NPDC048952 TaxID=3363961 RepID=UPI00371F9DFD
MTPLAELIDRHARSDFRTSISGLALSKIQTSEPDHELTEPLFVVMAQGAKRLLLGEQQFEYRAGDYLVVTTDLPVTGHFVDATRTNPALGLGLALRPEDIAPLLLRAPGGRAPDNLPTLATGTADAALLDAVTRLVRLLDHPDDAPVLAPLVVTEILWRLLTGPHGPLLRRIGTPDSDLSHVNRAIRWIRSNYAEPLRIDDLAQRAGMSPSAFHRRFRALTAMSPLQFQKRIRLQEARALLVADAGDVARVGHLVGYDSPSQFSREYRRQFGAPPGQDATRLRTAEAR